MTDTTSTRPQMVRFSQYRRSQIAELRPYVEGETLDRVSISAPDKEAGSPKSGDMIARNPKNHDDQWLVAAQYFADNFEPVASLPQPTAGSTGEAEAPKAVRCELCVGTGVISSMAFGNQKCMNCEGRKVVLIASTSAPALCEDEGCPHYGTAHVCVSTPAQSGLAQSIAMPGCGAPFCKHVMAPHPNCHLCTEEVARAPSQPAPDLLHDIRNHIISQEIAAPSGYVVNSDDLMQRLNAAINAADCASPQPDRESEREIDFETLAVEALHAWNNIPNTGFFSWPKDFPEGSRDGWRRVVRAIAGSSSGRTANFDFANGGSNPPPASTDLAAAHSEAKPAGLLNCDSLSASSSHGCSERISDGLGTVPQQAPSPSVQTLQGEE